MELHTLREWRLMREISQKEMAKRCGVNVNTYAKWESKPNKIAIGQAYNIANILKVAINDISFVDSTTK